MNGDVAVDHGHGLHLRRALHGEIPKAVPGELGVHRPPSAIGNHAEKLIVHEPAVHVPGGVEIFAKFHGDFRARLALILQNHPAGDIFAQVIQPHAILVSQHPGNNLAHDPIRRAILGLEAGVHFRQQLHRKPAFACRRGRPVRGKAAQLLGFALEQIVFRHDAGMPFYVRPGQDLARHALFIRPFNAIAQPGLAIAHRLIIRILKSGKKAVAQGHGQLVAAGAEKGGQLVAQEIAAVAHFLVKGPAVFHDGPLHIIAGYGHEQILRYPLAVHIQIKVSQPADGDLRLLHLGRVERRSKHRAGRRHIAANPFRLAKGLFMSHIRNRSFPIYAPDISASFYHGGKADARKICAKRKTIRGKMKDFIQKSVANAGK